MEFIELFLIFTFMFFIKFGKFWAILLQILFAHPPPFFLDSHNVLLCLRVPHKSLRRCSLSFSVFSFCVEDSMISLVLSVSLLILSSTCSNKPLNPSGKFFSFQLFIQYISAPEFVWFLSGFSIFLLIFLFFHISFS